MTHFNIAVAASVLALSCASACTHLSTKGVPQNDAVRSQPNSFTDDIEGNASASLKEGRNIFRHETFGDEFFWGDTLQLHLAIAGEPTRRRRSGSHAATSAGSADSKSTSITCRRFSATRSVVGRPASTKFRRH